MTQFDNAVINSITLCGATNHELSTPVNKKGDVDCVIPRDVVSTIMAICKRRGVSFDALKSPQSVKEKETLRSVIVMLRAVTSDQAAICEFIGIREDVYNAITHVNRINLADHILRRDIRDLVIDESRKIRRVEHDPS